MSSPQRTSREPLAAAEVAARTPGWYHTIDLGGGHVTPGLFDHRPFVARYGLPADLSGVRALDVGTFDGFWAFELERRGASVTALDVDSSDRYDWPPRLRPAVGEPRGERFALAAAALDSAVSRAALSVYDATPERLGGTFDLVFCGSMLVHLRDPMLALERLAALCSGRLVLAEEYSRRLEWLPGLRAVEFTGESAWMTWWRPTSRAWASMLEVAGFDEVRRRDRFSLAFRAQQGGVPHVVFHARGGASR